MELTEQVDLANEKAHKLQELHPKAIAAHYDRERERVVIRLSSRLDLSFSPQDAEGLEGARPEDLQVIEISPSGFGIYFPKLDADLYLPALLEGFLGSRKWMAGRLGSSGGKSKSKAKTAAAQKNGRLGGRPGKAAAAPVSISS